MSPKRADGVTIVVERDIADDSGRINIASGASKPVQAVNVNRCPLDPAAVLGAKRKCSSRSEHYRSCPTADISILADPSHGERDTDAKIASAIGHPSYKSRSLQSVDRDGTKAFNQKVVPCS
jgi:hypothetical protein